LVANVQRMAARLRADRHEFVGDALELVGLAACQRHRGAERGELVRRASSDSRAGARDEHDSAGEQPLPEDRPVGGGVHLCGVNECNSGTCLPCRSGSSCAAARESESRAGPGFRLSDEAFAWHWFQLYIECCSIIRVRRPTMTVQAPRRRKAARRAEILAAARQVFLERAFDEAAISEIAARAGCVEGTIYTYFRGKRDLFDAVLAEFYDRLVADIEPRLASISGTRDRLTYLIARHLQIVIDDPAFARLIVRESRGQSLYFGSKLHALNRRYAQFLQNALRDGV